MGEGVSHPRFARAHAPLPSPFLTLAKHTSWLILTVLCRKHCFACSFSISKSVFLSVSDGALIWVWLISHLVSTAKYNCSATEIIKGICYEFMRFENFGSAALGIGGWGIGYTRRFYKGRLRPEVQTFTPFYTIFDRRGNLVIYRPWQMVPLSHFLPIVETPFSRSVCSRYLKGPFNH